MATHPLEEARALVARVKGGLDAARGFFSGDLSGQWTRARAVLRHRRDIRELEDALLHFRYVYALMVAHRLGLLSRLRERPHTAEDVARGCGVQARAAELLLRVLEAQGAVRPDGERWVATGYLLELLSGDGPLSYAPLLELVASYAAGLDEVVGGLRTGQLAERMNVMDDGPGCDAFLDGVNRYLDNAGRELLARIALPEVRSFIVGSMGVSFSALLLRRFPRARVTYGCLPHLVLRIPRLRERYGVEEAKVAGTHAHTGLPGNDRWGDEAFDLVFLTRKMVLDPASGLGEAFARKAFAVLNPGGVAIFWEAVLDDGRPTPLRPALESLLDLGICPAGCAWTRNGLTRLLEGIGFRSIEVLSCLAGQTRFVVARKT